GAFGESSEMRQAVVDAGLTSQVEFVPRLPYDAALAEISGAGILLLLQASSDTVDLVPAKLFEYLRARRPVLAMVPDGATTEVMREIGGGWVVDPADSRGLHSAILAAYRAWVDGDLNAWAADPSALKKFSRERLAAQLARQFDALAGVATR